MFKILFLTIFADFCEGEALQAKNGLHIIVKTLANSFKKSTEEKVGKKWYNKLSKNLSHLQGLCKPCGKKGLHEKILVEKNGYCMQPCATLSPTTIASKKDYA